MFVYIRSAWLIQSLLPPRHPERSRGTSCFAEALSEAEGEAEADLLLLSSAQV